MAEAPATSKQGRATGNLWACWTLASWLLKAFYPVVTPGPAPQNVFSQGIVPVGQTSEPILPGPQE